MAKSRRKKNYKLRRRVMRTVAALTMIMAIVVAAIPVENYGTMRAASGVNMQTVYDNYADLTDYKDSEEISDDMPGDLGFGSNRTPRNIQVIEDGRIQDRYKADAKDSRTGSEALITAYVGGSSLIDVDEEMSYGYFFFPGDIIEDLKTQWSGEKYTIKYEIVTGQQINGVTIPNTFNLSSVPSSYSTMDPDNPNQNTSSSGDVTGTVTGTYTTTNLTVSELFTGDNAFALEQFTDYKNRLTDYNAAVQSLVEAVNAAGADAATNANISDQVTSLQQRYDNLTKELTVTFTDLKDLPGFVAGVICSRFSIQTSEITSNYSLKGFTLEYLDAADAYAVKWANSSATDIKADIDANSNDGGFRSSHVDGKGYLCDGFVRVIGIDGTTDNNGNRKGAFQDNTTITSVSLSDQIRYIGDDAFNGCTALSQANLNARNCTVIGDRAFKGCARLSQISFTAEDGTSSVRTLGAEAFQGCSALTYVDLPTNIQDIGRGCFANTGLTKFAFASDTTGTVVIYPFAFYGCESLGNVDNSFMPSKDGLNYIIGFGAFALSGTSNGGSMKSFEFPSRMTKIDNGTAKNTEFGAGGVFTNAGATDADGAYDYILAGRKGLTDVIFPANLNGDIPGNTLADCENLERAVMGKISFNDSEGRNISYSGENIFKDVMAQNFRVEGPGYLTNGTDKTEIRKSTLNLKMGLDTDSEGEEIFLYVPYMFLDADGNKRMEIVVGDHGEYLATIDQMDDTNRTARLVGYDLNPDSGASGSVEDLCVKAEIGGYRITRLGPGCFDEVKEDIEILTIEDNSVISIDADALREAPKLRLVRLANSIESIGSGAFADCPKLENVFFGEPVAVNDGAWGSVMTIGDDAFKTGSDHLTFHGVIDKDYAPFVYAMDATNTKFNTKDTNICYKSLGPSNLTVMRDNATGLNTLIDYPHLEEIDDLNQDVVSLLAKRFDWTGTGDNKFSILKRLGNVLGRQERVIDDYDSLGELADEERAVVEATLNIAIPSGVQSIDSKTFFESSLNDKSKEYLELLYNEEGEQLSWSRKIKPGIKEYYDTAHSSDGVVSGLFSGWFEEDFDNGIIKSEREYNGIKYAEINEQGNDHLTSVSMQSVSKLPDNYTFDDCENLRQVDMGEALTDIGIRPFRGCTSLTSDGITGNAYYKAENNVVYGSKEALDYSVLAECLETRMGAMNSDTDPSLKNVTEIAEEAFADCTTMPSINLQDTKIKKIPANCFNGAYGLSRVVLPKSVTSIESGAFDNLLKEGTNYTAIEVEIPNRACTIAADAFDLSLGVDITIVGEQFMDDTNQDPDNYTQVYTFAEQNGITFRPIEKEYAVQFWGGPDSRKLIKEVSVPAGEDIKDYPRYAETPSMAWDGHEFKEWLWVDQSTGKIITEAEGALLKVNENRRIEARYVSTSGDFVADGKEYTITVIGGTTYGETTRKVISGTPIMIEADDRDGYTLQYWSAASTADNTVDYKDFIGSPNNKVTTFIMPNDNVTVEAHFQQGGTTPVDPDATYMATVNYGTGGGLYKAGDMVTITADAPGTGRTFSGWTTTSTNVVFVSTTSATTSFIMPASNVTVTANYTGNTTNPTDPTNPTSTYTLTVQNGTGGGQFAQGATVTITANRPNDGASFVNWTTTTTGVTFASATASTTTFTMPASNVTVTANFSDGTGGQPGGSTTGTYRVTVNYGSGSGNYAAGATVNITANAPESSSRVFSRWTTANSGLGFANANAVSTSFVMPAADVTVTANYKTRTSSDDDDDDRTPSRRPGTNTNTTTVDNRPSNSTSTTTSTTGTVSNPTSGSSTTTNNNNGNRIYITKNGISNTDVASLAVSGSTDNFIVRITESPDATAAVEQALTNTYGSLNGLAYLPMDISLYDSTGQNKITDTTGLNITVTMPIPDVLIQYGGNARVAAADNGTLQQITPRFTTIDGIACVSFIPPHFSPYVIYVDTNNLIAGQMYDTTPATGDPIHPKWFAAIGMACVSILLFVMSDGRKRKKYRAA